jgi:uncharacterized protein (DUF305 family)
MTTATTATTEADATTAALGSAGEAEVTFAQNMIPHHEQAVMMADVALDPAVGASEAVRDLATRIREAQGPEIEQMRGWLHAWGASEMEEMSHDEHDAHGMQGMMSADEMAELEGMRGAEFDRMWMEMMIRHHEGAIAMAETARAEAALDDVKVLSDAIIKAQQDEIDEMQALLEAP